MLLVVTPNLHGVTTDDVASANSGRDRNAA
jgi:hypothetical protein